MVFYNNFYIIIIYLGPTFIYLTFYFFIKCAHRTGTWSLSSYRPGP